MALFNIFLTDIREMFYSPVVIEVTKVLFVSLGWTGGLAAFVYWKEKHHNMAGA